MGFRRLRHPTSEDQPYVSIWCSAASHDPWSIATFVLLERWSESPYYVEGGLRVARRSGRGTQQVLVQSGEGVREVPVDSVEAITSTDRTRLQLRCEICRDTLPFRRESLEPILNRLRQEGINSVPLSALRAIV